MESVGSKEALVLTPGLDMCETASIEAQPESTGDGGAGPKSLWIEPLHLSYPNGSEGIIIRLRDGLDCPVTITGRFISMSSLQEAG